MSSKIKFILLVLASALGDRSTKALIKIFEEKRMVHTIDLGGRAFLAISRGQLDQYVAEIYPFGISWGYTAFCDEAAIEQAQERAHDWAMNLVKRLR